MKNYSWEPEKNRELIETRGMSFESLVYHIETGDVLDVIDHPNPQRYVTQKIFIVRIDDYCWVVPFVEDNDEVFLKTAFPSRKVTKKYLNKDA